MYNLLPTLLEVSASGPVEVITSALAKIDTSVFLPMFAAVIAVIAVPTVSVIAAKKGWGWTKKGLKSVG